MEQGGLDIGDETPLQYLSSLASQTLTLRSI